ncbi:MAG: S-adenosyl-l-methionine hydroxide adenosyltransferase family protein [Clostridiaceae bacterium]|uniref:S-adenosyl-l-methionine hydroxide adenosyltransferase family protein n=1 Tax=Clostridium porci TaxID=2605778 RepID=A0A7X2NKR1_9CLOT|nr:MULTISPECIES: S-adenosyl-l-methionine hydroxide adenosyltransferase family protein [Clostridium]MCI6139150.1 S-adenosyl-l-methionine hydroxide adenosyltransferase family protein [Clostridium sp.]MDY3232741.1 S-adenosyl-l-methionine hydroxide adenosyltransferase family protein [Clostridiaceae bacterium]MSS36689.1 S-adenosyl-l-methionine hydroxide adenosyltransferase family protein [Clostridium porci]
MRKRPLILQSDFGTSDGAVSAMYGVAYGVDQELKISDLTHEIPQYDIWEASYRLIQTLSYWPEGSVFVSVVDPGVGSTRRSIVVETKAGQYIVSPDNGTLTHIKRMIGLKQARVIDERVNRLPNSGESYTFHGRDIYAYTGARLAAGVITFEEVGPQVDVESVIELPIVEAIYDGEKVRGTIDVLDVRFGSLWTNISRDLFKKLGVDHGGRVEISIENGTRTLYKNILAYAKSFADVYVGEPLVYVNSLDCMAVAINQGSFARAYNIGTGTSWRITIRKAPRLVYENESQVFEG